MIGKIEFAKGLARVALSLRQAFSAEEQGVYYEALGDQIDAPEWEAFTRDAVRSQRWTTYLPTVSQILDALREFRGETPVAAEAVAAYERTIAAGTYTPEGGTSWSFRAVLDRCGRAAAEAFLEAGGHNAFVTTWDESKRRERFLAAYCAVARAEPEARLLPAGDRAALPAGGPISRDEAARLLDKIAAIHSAEEA